MKDCEVCGSRALLVEFYAWVDMTRIMVCSQQCRRRAETVLAVRFMDSYEAAPRLNKGARP